jgi:hypothetical protein
MSVAEKPQPRQFPVCREVPAKVFTGYAAATLKNQ